MALSILVASLGIGLSWLMYYKKKLSADEWAKKTGPLYKLSLNKYYFDEHYQKYLIQPTLRLAEKIAYIDWELYDKYFINGFGRITDWLSRITGKLDYEGIDQTLVDGTGRTIGRFGSSLKKVQTGKIQNYLLFVLAGVIIILVFQTI
jgi:NADH-quinone oxidoreductase subunit L